MKFRNNLNIAVIVIKYKYSSFGAVFHSNIVSNGEELPNPNNISFAARDS